MSNAIVGKGSSLQVQQASAFVEITEAQTAQFSGSKADLADVTHFQSPQGFREFIATLVDAGDVSCTANYLPHDANQATLQILFNEQTKASWQMVLPNTLGILSFDGFVSSLDRDISFDKEIKLSFKIKITGPVVYSLS